MLVTRTYTMQARVYQFSAKIEETLRTHQGKDHFSIGAEAGLTSPLDVELGDPAKQLAFAENRRLHSSKIFPKRVVRQRTKVTDSLSAG